MEPRVPSVGCSPQPLTSEPTWGGSRGRSVPQRHVCSHRLFLCLLAFVENQRTFRRSMLNQQTNESNAFCVNFVTTGGNNLPPVERLLGSSSSSVR